MAVNDIGFYNVTGEYITRTGLVEQMIGYYNLKLGEGETKITDFNEGSEIRNLLEAIAVDMYILMQQVNKAGDIAFIPTAEGFWLDKHGANPFINLPRILGTEATGTVKFTMPTAQDTPLTIPGGTILISYSTGLEFITNMDTTIETGATNTNVNVTCATRGEDGNIPADDLTIILDPTFPNGLTVTNISAFTGGVDMEDDDTYRERLLAHVRKDDFGSIGYYEELLEGVNGVHDVKLVDVTGYTKKAVVNGFVKPTPDSVLLECLALLSDVDRIVLGHSFTVDTPTYVGLDLTVNLGVTREYSSDELENILETFLNGGSSDYIVEFDGFRIGEGVTYEAFCDMFSVLDGVVSVEIVDNDTGLVLSDVVLSSDEVMVLEDVSFVQSLVE